MSILAGIFENLLVMILSILVLIAGGYFFLLIVHYGLKIRSRGREEEGLAILWQDNVKPGSDRKAGRDKP